MRISQLTETHVNYRRQCHHIMRPTEHCGFGYRKRDNAVWLLERTVPLTNVRHDSFKVHSVQDPPDRGFQNKGTCMCKKKERERDRERQELMISSGKRELHQTCVGPFYS